MLTSCQFQCKINQFTQSPTFEEGIVTPISFKWKDGRVFQIDRVVDKRTAASTKVGGCGIRYLVKIRENERYLFEEDGRWFVEVPGYQ